MVAIEQKNTPDAHFLFKLLAVVVKIAYICTQIPSRAVSKRHCGNEK